MIKDNKILVLNKYYFPIAVGELEKTFGNIFSGTVYPLDINYELDEDGNVMFDSIESFTAITDVDEWLSLPIRPYDNFLQTTRGAVRIPQVVITSKFSKIIFNKVQFPTKANIYKRDNYTCVYTGKKLQKHELSIDHVIPTSKGGKNTWENMATCDRQLNSKKSDKLLSECGLKLRYKPYKPDNGLAFELYKDEWASFLKGF